MYHPTRGGVRGGRDQFSWDDVKVDKHRENYLGHSIKAPVGRWQKGKDLHWYTRENNSKGSDDALKEEIKRIKEEEEQAMREALGLAPKRSSRPQGNRLDKHDFQELVKRSSTAEDMGAGHADAAWVHGLGFSRYDCGRAYWLHNLSLKVLDGCLINFLCFYSSMEIDFRFHQQSTLHSLLFACVLIGAASRPWEDPRTLQSGPEEVSTEKEKPAVASPPPQNIEKEESEDESSQKKRRREEKKHEKNERREKRHSRDFEDRRKHRRDKEKRRRHDSD
ncbi:hypothetical protein WN943_018985 [Citrus x changshan-huyou]